MLAVTLIISFFLPSILVQILKISCKFSTLFPLVTPPKILLCKYHFHPQQFLTGKVKSSKADISRSSTIQSLFAPPEELSNPIKWIQCGLLNMLHAFPCPGFCSLHCFHLEGDVFYHHLPLNKLYLFSMVQLKSHLLHEVIANSTIHCKPLSPINSWDTY